MSKEPEAENTFPTLGPMWQKLRNPRLWLRIVCWLPYQFWRATRWLWRKTWRYSLGLLIVLIIAHIVLNLIASRRLEAEFQKIHAAGEPLSMREAAPRPVPDKDNAAAIYSYLFRHETGPINTKWLLSEENWQGGKKWGATVLTPDDMEKVWVFLGEEIWKPRLDDNGKPFFPFQKYKVPTPTMPQMEAAIQRSARQFALLKQASLMPACRFPVRWDDGINAIFPQLSGVRQATYFLVAKAIVDAHKGDSTQAMDDLSVAVRMISQTTNDPTLIDVLAQIAWLRILQNNLPRVLAEAPPTPQQAQAFYDELGKLDLQASLVHAMQGERASGIWTFNYARKHSIFMLASARPEMQKRSIIDRAWPTLVVIGAPFYKLDEVEYLKVMEREIGWLHEPIASSYEKQQAFESDMAGAPPFGPPRYAIISRILVPVCFVPRMKTAEGIASVRLMQAAMVLRSYQAEHGAYPASLAELAAAGGLAIPEDPFSGKPFIYKRQGAGYLIYSVGPNMKDDQGIGLTALREKNLRRPDVAKIDNMAYDVPLRVER
jgi:hypothetical protein